MTIEQLACFQAITEHDTFLQAADALHISQSSLSKQLKKLEEELGVSLIDRSRRSAALTEAGVIFAGDVQLILMQHQIALSHLTRFKTDRSIRIGTLPLLGQYHLSEKIAAFTAAHPEIKVELNDVEEAALVDDFRAGRYDLIISRPFSPEFEALDSVIIARDELVAVMRESHPLSAAEHISLRDLRTESLLLMKPYTAIYKLCQKIFLENDLSPEEINTSRLETIFSRIVSGGGIGIVPYRNYMLFRQPHLAAVPFSPAIPLEIRMYACRNGLGRPSQELMRMLAAH